MLVSFFRTFVLIFLYLILSLFTTLRSNSLHMYQRSISFLVISCYTVRKITLSIRRLPLSCGAFERSQSSFIAKHQKKHDLQVVRLFNWVKNITQDMLLDWILPKHYHTPSFLNYPCNELSNFPAYVSCYSILIQNVYDPLRRIKFQYFPFANVLSKLADVRAKS